MNALITLKAAEADLTKHMAALETKKKLKEELTESLIICGTGGVAGSIILAVPELCDMDNDYSLSDTLANAALGFAVGAGAGFIYDQASKRLFVGRRAKAFEKSVTKLKKAIDDDYLAVKESYGNIFESYADGYQIEHEIYNFGFELATFEETKAHLIAEKDVAEAEVKRLSDAILSVFGHKDNTMLNLLSDQKAEKLKAFEAASSKLKQGELILENKDHLLAELKTRYAVTLANRMARDKFSRLFLEGLAKDAAYLKEVAGSAYTSTGGGKDLVRHQKAVEAIRVHHTILIRAYKEIVRDLDTYRDKTTSSLSRIRNNMKGKRGVDMTYANAPFYKSFFIAKSFRKAQLKAEGGVAEILTGANEDFLNGHAQGTWLGEQAYAEEDLSEGVFTKDDRNALKEHLVFYFEEGVTSMEDFEAVNRAYKKFVKDKHSDVNGADGGDELIAAVSTLMHKLRAYTRSKEELGGEK